MAQGNHSRRNFIKGAGVAGFGSLLVGASAAPEPSTKLPKSPRAKNLIFLVVDGMNIGTLSLAHYWKLQNSSEALNWMQLYSRSDLVTSLQDTASLSSPVTDSAAAASAWGCGQRVPNRSINYSAEGQALVPLMELSKRAGKANGLVSTCRITHATPAGFAASVPHRDAEGEIARQYLEREIDVLLGGGLEHFRSEDNDLIEGFRAKGYTIAYDHSDLLKVRKQSRVLGLFSDSHLPYAIDLKREEKEDLPRKIPQLYEMMEAALRALGSPEQGFVLQVEGGRVDHACHVNDIGATLHEQLEFDRCISLASDYIEKHPDTLLIVTTDHGTGGCQLNGWGKDYSESASALDRINEFDMSFEVLAEIYRSRGIFDPGHFEKKTGIRPNAEQTALVQEAIETEVRYLNSYLTKVFEQPLLEKTAVGWTSNNHTADFVELLAIGPGSERIPAFIQNFELHAILREAMQI